ncbi:PhzF family phenazine biosynthesis protein [Paenibacillus alvei]|uniref:PhzF family phenazine biosynthesis protein n=1 Tax=Paenibacillus alvei TaxID=44250 RepID=UPI003D27A2D8
MKVYIVDAFTDAPFRGNPAAVCLVEQEWNETLMQHIASEMNLSETAFVHIAPEGDRHILGLRWFTPEVEVDLCGHATLATAHVLRQCGIARGKSISFDTLSGILHAEYKEGGDKCEITLDFPASMLTPVDDEALCIRLEDALGCSIHEVFRSRNELVAAVDSEQTVRELQPNWEQLKACGHEEIGVLVTALADESAHEGIDFVSRCFFPRLGVNEDPVTGSAHCTTGPYWGAKLGKSSLVGRQCSAREGIVKLKLQEKRVQLTGTAVSIMEGQFTFSSLSI